MKQPIESYKHVERLNESQCDDLCALYRSEWWSRDRTREEIRLMLQHTDFIIGFAEPSFDRLVAFARVLTDRVYKAFLFDVIVHAEHRSLGLGRTLMDTIVSHPVLHRVQTIELYCRPELVPLYAKWGFSDECAGCVLMRRPCSN